MNKELDALNYLVNLAVVGNKKKDRGKIFDSEEIIFEVLKRNEPLPIIKYHVCNFYTGQETFAFCPTCNHTIIDRPNFCPECGQRLKKEKENDK